MEFAATLAYMQHWTSKAIATNNEIAASEHNKWNLVPLSKIMYPAESNSHNNSLKSVVAALKEDWSKLIKEFSFFQKNVLLGDTCISDSAKALTACICELLNQKPN